jgi:hypothetical protein
MRTTPDLGSLPARVRQAGNTLAAREHSAGADLGLRKLSA